MSGHYLVVAQFRYLDELLTAVRELKSRGARIVDIYSPFPNHEIEELLFADERPSPVRRFTLFGAILGCLMGFLFTVWTAVDYPLRVSAKPIIGIPAFVVIAFECTILFGALATLVGMLHFNRLPNIRYHSAYRRSFSLGTFGLVVESEEQQGAVLQAEVQRFGAESVEVQYAR